MKTRDIHNCRMLLDLDLTLTAADAGSRRNDAAAADGGNSYCYPNRF